MQFPTTYKRKAPKHISRGLKAFDLCFGALRHVVGVAKLIFFSRMTIYEALKLSGCMIEQLERAGARLSDHKYVGLFEDYRIARERGKKVSYIVAVLAERYSVSERNVYEIVKRLGSDCKSVSP